jgi:hypothetical protein
MHGKSQASAKNYFFHCIFVFLLPTLLKLFGFRLNVFDHSEGQKQIPVKHLVCNFSLRFFIQEQGGLSPVWDWGMMMGNKVRSAL